MALPFWYEYCVGEITISNARRMPPRVAIVALNNTGLLEAEYNKICMVWNEVLRMDMPGPKKRVYLDAAYREMRKIHSRAPGYVKVSKHIEIMEDYFKNGYKSQ